MEPIIKQAEQFILFMSEHVPLELFVFVGALIEEVVAPIPSMLVMTTAGFLTHTQGHTVFFLVWLLFIGNLGKIFGSLGWYVVGDKLEDIVVGRFGRFFGLTHGDIERIGKRFTGRVWQDGAIIFLLRAIPFFPSLAVSLACGVIKIELRTFILASYFGNMVKDTVYISIGYFGAQAFWTLLIEMERVRLGLGLLITLVVVIGLVLAYRERHRGLHLLSRLYFWAKAKWQR